VRITVRVVLLATLATLSLPSARADIATVLPVCNACHGADGVSPLPGVPTLAGLSELVIENALIDYRAGARPCAGPQSPNRSAMDMCGPATLVAEEDLEALAAHYASLAYRPKTQEIDAAQAAIGRDIHARECEICHVDGGRDPSFDTSILAGQDLGYLRQALEDFAQQSRPTSAPKQAKFAQLDAEALDALAQFYASQQ
jgi:sulfide dehydrogenase cytochrome subunit